MNKQTVRIPFFVESQRGDDRLGTNMNTGAIISDHEASQTGVPFQQGIPQSQIQKAVEIQLQQDKWVCIEKNDGSTDLLTKKDLPKLYPAPTTENVHFVQLPHIEFKPAPIEPPKEQPKQDDWRTAFAVNPPAPPAPKPKSEPPVKTAPLESAKTTSSPFAVKTPKPATTQTCSEPKKPAEPKEQWASLFENIKSATATHKGKGG